MDNSKFFYKIDNYSCIKFDLGEKQNSDLFLKRSEEELKQLVTELEKEAFKNNVKAIWLYIPIESSHLISCFASEKFVFHHTENGNLLVMSKWLRSGPSNLPNYATHYFGVGGLIINEEGKVLLVKEKHTLVQLKGMWKIPTGLANMGESIEQAVLREVKEETGLSVDYLGVYNFREAYPYLFNCCDVFFICICTIKGDDQKVNIISGDELEEYKWFTVEEIRQLVLDSKNLSKGNQSFFSSIVDFLPDKIKNMTLKASKEIKFLNSRFIFHNPKY